MNNTTTYPTYPGGTPEEIEAVLPVTEENGWLSPAERQAEQVKALNAKVAEKQVEEMTKEEMLAAFSYEF